MKKRIEPISEGNTKLNLGCGKDIKKEYLNVDKFKPYDQFLDISKTQWEFKDNTFDEIFCNTVLEHITNPLDVIKECHRILKPDGILIVLVPYSLSQHAFITPLHRSFYTWCSFDYFDKTKDISKDNEMKDCPKFKIVKYAFGTPNVGGFIPHLPRRILGLYLGNIVDRLAFVMKK